MERFRGIFERFQNLNLLTLIEDVKRGYCARLAWILQGRMCPLSHGLKSYVRFTECLNATEQFDVAAFHIGCSTVEARAFVSAWDDDDKHRGRLILPMLESIFAERLADADAVQAVISPALEASCV